MGKNIVKCNTKNKAYIDNAPIFKFLNPNGNDKLSQMSRLELQELIILLDDYYIELRNSLGFEQYITFSFELELEDVKRDIINSQLKENFPGGDWTTKYDGSLKWGCEISTPPLRDNKESWENLDKVCCIIDPLASIGENCSCHNHIGTQILGDDKNSWLNCIKLLSVYENIISRFFYGEFLTARPKILLYAKPVAEDFWKYYQKLKSTNASLEAIINMLSSKEDQAINFRHVEKDNCNNFKTGNTIEIRYPNGTKKAAICQNNFNLSGRMLIYSGSKNFNDDLVEQRHILNSNRHMGLKSYDEIFLEQALELCDMVFTNNFDKVYFLKQYLKSFQIYQPKEDYLKPCILTKK